jgi:hypothetical protein
MPTTNHPSKVERRTAFHLQQWKKVTPSMSTKLASWIELMQSEEWADLEHLQTWIQTIGRQLLTVHRQTYHPEYIWRASWRIQEYFRARTASPMRFPSYCAVALLLAVAEWSSTDLDLLDTYPNLVSRDEWNIMPTTRLRQYWYRLLVHGHPRFVAPRDLTKRWLVGLSGTKMYLHWSGNRWVVEKVFPWSCRWRLIRECQALHRLNHPHIIPYLGFRRYATSVGIVTPKAASTLRISMELDQKVKCQSTSKSATSSRPSKSDPRISITQKWRWLRQLAEAVAYAHRQKVAHRDIKPSNIYLQYPGQDLWLADWDASIVITNSIQMLHLASPVCTFPFCAPEVFGRNDYNPFALDVWSVGIIALWLLTGVSVCYKPASVCRSFMLQLLQNKTNPHWDASMQCIADACFRPAGSRVSAQMLAEIIQAVSSEAN